MGLITGNILGDSNRMNSNLLLRIRKDKRKHLHKRNCLWYNSERKKVEFIIQARHRDIKKERRGCNDENSSNI